MAANETTTIRVPEDQAEEGRSLLPALVGARMGSFDWTHKKPTLGDLFILGLETAKAKLQKAK